MMLVSEALAWLVDPAHWSGPGGVGRRVFEHLAITGAVLALACLLALPLGLVIGHTRRGAGLVGALVGAARAIPSLGLLTLIGLWLGIGLEAPILTLVALAVPSVLAGAYSGVQALDPAIPEAARAIGFSPLQIVLLVEVPLALPVILGGVRAATLQVVATATLAAYTADVGLGRFLFAGLKSRDYPQMLGGALLVIVLALALEVTFAALQMLSRRAADPAQVGDQAI